MRRRLAEDRADEQRQAAADRDEEERRRRAPSRGRRRSARRPGRRPRRRRSGPARRASGTAARRSRTRPGRCTSPIRKPPISAGTRSCRARSASRGARAGRAIGLALAELRLAEQRHLADERERGAADHHQVGRAPERHVLAEDPVPEVVEREARAARSALAASRPMPPSGAYQSSLIRTAAGSACPRAGRSRRSRR